MIYFQTKPDAVFEAILQEALFSEMTEVKMLGDDGAIDSWEGLYPETSSVLGPYRAIRIMAQLLAAIRDASIYRLTDLHWLVLYECLQNFCATHNDLAEDDLESLRPIGSFRLGYIDGEALAAIYFWDTDFLLRPFNNAGTRLEQDSGESCDQEEETEELETNVIPEDVPPLEMVDDIAWIIPEPSAFFRTGSIRYPDTRG